MIVSEEKGMADVKNTVCQIIGATLFSQPIPSQADVDWSAINKEFVDQAIVAIPASILEKLPIPKEIDQQ